MTERDVFLEAIRARREILAAMRRREHKARVFGFILHTGFVLSTAALCGSVAYLLMALIH